MMTFLSLGDNKDTETEETDEDSQTKSDATEDSRFNEQEAVQSIVNEGTICFSTIFNVLLGNT